MCEDEAPNTVLHNRCAFPWTGSNVPIASDGEPPLNSDSPQPNGVVGAPLKNVVLKHNIVAHLFEFIGQGLRERGVNENHATCLGISHCSASLICLGVTSKS